MPDLPEEDNGVFDLPNDIFGSIPTLPTRNNKDHKVSGYSEELIDLCIGSSLAILNGRTLGDLLGNITCIKWNGVSAPDYFLSSYGILNDITYMKVNEYTPYSDHCPLELKLSLKHPISRDHFSFKFDSAPKRFKWNHDSSKLFNDKLNEDQTTQTILDALQLNVDNADDLLQLNSYVEKIFYNTAANTLTQTGKPPKWQNKNKWYDNDLRNLKREVSRSCRRLALSPESTVIRNELYQLKKAYKKETR